MERKLIFDAALKLIREGKFHSTPMSEIAYHARLTESTTIYFFDTREKLLRELAHHIRAVFNQVINEVTHENVSFEERFFNMWIALYEFYVRRPDVLTFIEQSRNLGPELKESLADARLLELLVEFFAQKENTLDGLRPETLAAVFHGNVITAAKISQRANNDQEDLRYIAHLLWGGLSSSVEMVNRP